MNRVNLDAEKRALLDNAQSPTVVCDGAGNVLGLYVPKSGFEDVLAAFVSRKEPSREELAAARTEGMREAGLSPAGGPT